MPQHTINMLEELLENGGNEENKILGAGIKATLEHVADMQEDVAFVKSELVQHIKNNEIHVTKEFHDCAKKHVLDKEQHTPKGILVRGIVIAWAVFIMIIVSTIVCYLPEKLGILTVP